jgi:hypothetical protein
MRRVADGRFRLPLLLLLVLGALCLAPGSASAGTVFGADLNQSPTNTTGNLSMTNVIHPGGAADDGTPVSGILTSVRVRTTGSMGGTGVIRVLTLVSHPDLTTYVFSNSGPEVPVTLAPDSTTAGHVTQVLTRRPITAGQRLGWHSTTNVFGLRVSYNDVTSECAYSAENHPTGANLSYTTEVCNQNVILVAGTVEADADRDGFGDETQDACPSNASTQGPCPKRKCKKKHKKRSATEAKKKKCKKKHHRHQALTPRLTH